MILHLLNLSHHLNSLTNINAFQFSYKVTTNSSCYASWVWTGYEPFKLLPSRYIILNKCNRFVVMANMSNILSVIIEIRDRWLKEEKHTKKGGLPEDTKVLLI